MSFVSAAGNTMLRARRTGRATRSLPLRSLRDSADARNPNVHYMLIMTKPGHDQKAG